MSFLFAVTWQRCCEDLIRLRQLFRVALESLVETQCLTDLKQDYTEATSVYAAANRSYSKVVFIDLIRLLEGEYDLIHCVSS